LNARGGNKLVKNSLGVTICRQTPHTKKNTQKTRAGGEGTVKRKKKAVREGARNHMRGGGEKKKTDAGIPMDGNGR